MHDYNSPRQYPTLSREVTCLSLLFPPLLLLIYQKIYKHDLFQIGSVIQVVSIYTHFIFRGPV